MASRSSSRSNRLVFTLWLLDMSVVLAAVLLAERLRFMGDPASLDQFIAAGPARELLLPLFVTVAMACFGLYQTHGRHNHWDFLLRLMLSFVLAGVVLVVVYYLLPGLYIGRGVLALSLVLGFIVVLSLRQLARHFFMSDIFRRRIVVLGAGNNASLINSTLRRRSDRQSFLIVGFMELPGQQSAVPDLQRIPSGTRLVDLVVERQIHELVVAPDERRGGLPMEEMLRCAQMGIAVTELSTFFEREAGLVKLGVVDPSWLVFSGGFDHSLPRRVSKRLFDIVAAATLLALTWPIMLIVAPVVALESGFPILYWQSRVGKGGQPFNLVKFRSMRVDAEGDGKARWAAVDDDRSTRFGRFMRRTRLDELPQLFNVLAGHMSFVGPRPERPQFVGMLNEEIRFYHVRHSVKPGLTGWAQLRYPYGASVRDAEEKLKFDLFYVKNHGFVFDLMILLQTVEVVLFRRGAR